MFHVNFSRLRPSSRFSSLRDNLRYTTSKQKRWVATLASFGALAAFALVAGCGTSSNPVSSTSNPQVALYVFQGQSAGNVTVEFGTTKAYGLKTSPQPVPSGGVPVRIYVAGMRANTLYHMRAVATYDNGKTETGPDQTFVTGSYTDIATNALPQIKVTTSPGQTPQPGIEIVNGVAGAGAQLLATDLSGNVIWAYIPTTPIPAPSFITAPKQLPNGNFIFVVGPSSSQEIYSPSTIPASAPDLIREIDLAGNTVKEITIAQLNTELKAANYNNLTLLAFHHEVTVLPNGHWLVLANTIRNVVLTGQPTPTKVLGDVIVDLDTNLNPVWVWNEFDHLDVNRHPMSFPDWTHTNAIIYSKDDGNLLVSMRHQNWLVKVDYNNGAGTGNILWRLGEAGDFTLQNGADPADWFYAQHGPSFTTPNTTGIFGLVLMDNGDDRLGPTQFDLLNPADPIYPSCGKTGSYICYTTVPILQINEVAKTATLMFHQEMPPNLYAFFGGNAEQLPNGDVEYDLCGLPGSVPHSQVMEVTNNVQNPQTVWTLQLNTQFAYRAFRLPSLYPGVQW